MTVVSKVHASSRSRAGGENRTAGYGQIVLVLQGGGALGAYQSGVYHALHEAGVEPDWVIGTSIGAINAALIVGNEPDNRLAALQEFWHRVTARGYDGTASIVQPLIAPLYGGKSAHEVMAAMSDRPERSGLRHRARALEQRRQTSAGFDRRGAAGCTTA